VRDLFSRSVLLLLVLVSAHVFRVQGYAQITAGVATSRSGCFRGFEIADEGAEWNRTYGGRSDELANAVQD
jgi:hypothetical protein